MTLDASDVLGPAALAAGSGAVLVGSAILLLRRFGVVDVPNARSSHSRVTVRGAGVGVALAAILTGVVVLLVDDVPARQPMTLLVGSATFAVLGLVDDIRGGIPARWRLLAQVVIAVALAVGLVTDFDPAVLLFIALPIGSIWFVAYVNAFNFMDGINGISAISAVVAGAAYAAMGLVLDDLLIAALGGVVAGAALGFLPFNFPRARAFLGDVGSYFLGAWLAAMAVLVVRAGGAPWSAIAPLSLYLADTGWTIIRRARRGEHLLSAHRNHVYQRLAANPSRHVAVAATVGFLTICLSVIGVLTVDSGIAARTIAIASSLALLVAYLGLPSLVERSNSRGA